MSDHIVTMKHGGRRWVEAIAYDGAAALANSLDSHLRQATARITSLESQLSAMTARAERAYERGFKDAMDTAVACQELRGLLLREVQSNGQTFRFFDPPEDFVHLADGSIRKIETLFECPTNASGSRMFSIDPGQLCIVVSTKQAAEKAGKGE